jgi:hypothetical protein
VPRRPSPLRSEGCADDSRTTLCRIQPAHWPRDYIPNNDGHLQWAAQGDFQETCKITVLNSTGTLLSSFCATLSGAPSRNRFVIDLNDCITNDGGDRKYMPGDPSCVPPAPLRRGPRRQVTLGTRSRTALIQNAGIKKADRVRSALVTFVKVSGWSPAYIQGRPLVRHHALLTVGAAIGGTITSRDPCSFQSTRI